MTDLEKVIKGLDCCTSDDPDKCKNECPYRDEFIGCVDSTQRDALKLLREIIS